MVVHLDEFLGPVGVSRSFGQGYVHFGKMSFLDLWTPNYFAFTNIWY